MSITRAPELRMSDLRSGPALSVRSYIKDHVGSAVSFYNTGRSALYKGLMAHARKGSALVPSYVCHEAVLPFRRAGLNVCFYKMDEELSPDLEDLESKLNDDVTVLMTVNYFGFPAKNFEAVDDLCRQHDVLHIEDNAHSVLSEINGTLLGTRGDFGFSSLRKLLPMPDGGIAYSPNLDRTAPRRLGRSEIEYLLRTIVKSVDSRVLNGTIERRYAEEGESGRSTSFQVESMSPLSHHVLSHAHIDDIVPKRRENFRLIADCLVDAPGIEPLFTELPKGICPQVAPAVVDDPNALVKCATEQGVPVVSWPQLPAVVDGNDTFSTANYLSNKTLTFPIHQTVESKTLGRLVSKVVASK